MKRVKIIFLILIILNCTALFARLPEDEVQFFSEIFDPFDVSIPGSREENPFDYPLRLVNLTNTRHSANISELPSWKGSYEMGGIFTNIMKIVGDDYLLQWGSGYAFSDIRDALKAGSPVYNKDGSMKYDYWAEGYGGTSYLKSSEEYKSFYFHKNIDGNEILIGQPKMVNFLGLAGNKYRILHSDRPRIANGCGELRLFIPFIDGEYILIGGQRFKVPTSGHLGTHPMHGKPEINRWDVQKKPGLCILFHPISYNTPHRYSNSKENTLASWGGDVMSSLRNREIYDYNMENGTHLPFVDWGFQGYYEAYESDILANLVPILNEDCLCRGSYSDVVGYDDKYVYWMDCRDKSDGQRPEKVLGKLDSDEFAIEINGVMHEINSTEPNYYRGANIGYAVIFFVKNPDKTERDLINWTNGDRFTARLIRK